MGKEVIRFIGSQARCGISRSRSGNAAMPEAFLIEEVGAIAITGDQLLHLTCRAVGPLISCHQERSQL
jgi:hypothetical protein